MARARIMQIHSRKMNVDKDDSNFEELARCCDDFNGAQCKAICVEARMTSAFIDDIFFARAVWMRRPACWHSDVKLPQSNTKTSWKASLSSQLKKKGPSTTMPDEYFENTSSPMHIPGSSLIYIGARDILPIFKIGPLQRIE